ncbi:hypothetical protein [Pectobacterium actinidiae]|uniref:hypothetical protein n=1 Tax=Pectobacterium actinidiae TaxID=1507808 RepID=UPI0038177953
MNRPSSCWTLRANPVALSLAVRMLDNARFAGRFGAPLSGDCGMSKVSRYKAL